MVCFIKTFPVYKNFPGSIATLLPWLFRICGDGGGGKDEDDVGDVGCVLVIFTAWLLFEMTMVHIMRGLGVSMMGRMVVVVMVAMVAILAMLVMVLVPCGE